MTDSPPPVRTYVLDTSVLLSDPWAATRFAEHEVVVPLGQKDYWNALMPADDKKFLGNVQRPELAKLLPVLYPGVRFIARSARVHDLTPGGYDPGWDAIFPAVDHLVAQGVDAGEMTSESTKRANTPATGATRSSRASSAGVSSSGGWARRSHSPNAQST